jgi:hypothetical protein
VYFFDIIYIQNGEINMQDSSGLLVEVGDVLGTWDTSCEVEYLGGLLWRIVGTIGAGERCFTWVIQPSDDMWLVV